MSWAARLAILNRVQSAPGKDASESHDIFDQTQMGALRKGYLATSPSSSTNLIASFLLCAIYQINIYRDHGGAQMQAFPVHKLLVKALRQNGWHEVDSYFKSTLADYAPPKVVLRMLANEERVYGHYPGLYTLDDGYMALYGFLNKLLQASLQSKGGDTG
ncbi:hypothetical protein FN846DRAFT_903834 [Sphaerosporella brunnea]|uniref:Uncharacterized protein n=1 Tax=Sphaerosporella brunnea TaxID=1250544 RepID=A0A5J5F6C4_9PEZI|nr:hypothetical protein FN846DRAFT_903834 [Sphaerosporella brunnea]